MFIKNMVHYLNLNYLTVGQVENKIASGNQGVSIQEHNFSIITDIINNTIQY